MAKGPVCKMKADEKTAKYKTTHMRTTYARAGISQFQLSMKGRF